MRHNVTYQNFDSQVRTDTRFSKSFIGHLFLNNPKYKFISHLEYFLKNRRRWQSSEDILERLLIEVPADVEEAWKEWRQFRSAQAEVTAIFLIENYLSGNITGLEVPRGSNTKTCDIVVNFGEKESFIEVKAQSGQQHGDKHPLSNELTSFQGKSEDDLHSWLFEGKISSRDGKIMKPYCFQASEKDADILIAMIDIFFAQSKSLDNIPEVICPDSKHAYDKLYHRKRAKNKMLDGFLRRFEKIIFNKQDHLKIKVIYAGSETRQKMRGLKELWLFDESYLPDMLIIKRNSIQLTTYA